MTSAVPLRPPPPAGFTLIELTAALILVAVLFGAAVTGVGALTGSQARSAAGELGGVVRALYDTAALTGKTCRLVFQMPGEKEENKGTKYWAECAAGAATARKDRDAALKDANREREERSRNPRGGRSSSDRREGDSSAEGFQDMMAKEKDRVEAQAAYSRYTAPEISPRDLPRSVELSIWTQHQREAASTGLAYLYFFPSGYTEKAMVFVRQGNNAWTVTVAPLTGKTAVVSELLEVPRS